MMNFKAHLPIMHIPSNALKLPALAISLLAFLILGAGANPAHGQADIRLGVKGALNLADLQGDDADLLVSQGQDLERRMGFVAGGFAQVDLNEIFGLRPELAYVQKGAWAETLVGSGEQIVTAESTLKIDYIELPALATMTLPMELDARAFFLAGPALAFNVSGEQEFEINGQTESVDVSDAINSVDAGLHLGVGADVPIDAGTVTVQARVEIGMVDLPDEGDADVQNQGIRFSAGYIF